MMSTQSVGDIIMITVNKYFIIVHYTLQMAGVFNLPHKK